MEVKSLCEHMLLPEAAHPAAHRLNLTHLSLGDVARQREGPETHRFSRVVGMAHKLIKKSLTPW